MSPSRPPIFSAYPVLDPAAMTDKPAGSPLVSAAGAGTGAPPAWLPEEEAQVMAALLAGSSDFIGIAGLDDQVMFINAAGRALVGLPGEADLSRTAMIDYIAPAHRDAFRAQALPALLARGSWAGETWLVNHRSGLPTPVWHRVFTVRPARAEAPAVIATVSRDVSERQAAAKALAQAREDLARASQVGEMSELAASIAHEINQPLAAMAANAQACLHWLAHEPPNLTEARSAARRVAADSLRGGQIIDRMRSLVRQLKPQTTRVDLNEMLRGALQQAQPVLSDEPMSLRLELAAGLPPVRGDELQLQQVVINLLKNAVDAMLALPPAGRELAVRSLLSASGELRVEVEDNGEGLPPEGMDRLFEPFHSDKPDGMGLGLAISRRIVEAHGGQLWLAAGEPGGTLASFSLPPFEETAA